MGTNRAAKKAIEGYWAGKINEQELQDAAKAIRKERWEAQKNAGVDIGESSTSLLLSVCSN